MSYRLNRIFYIFSETQQADRYIIKHTPELNFKYVEKKTKCVVCSAKWKNGNSSSLEFIDKLWENY